VRRALGVVAVAVAVLVVPSCGGDGRGKVDEAQCGLLSSADVAKAVAADSPAGVLFDHQKDRDGTWCLFNTAAGRIETRFQPGQQSDFTTQRDACRRDDPTSHDVAADAGGLMFCSAGIPRAIGFRNGSLITVHALDGTNADVLTTAVAKTALSRCCPAT
jgi:hypothetical protein